MKRLLPLMLMLSLAACGDKTAADSAAPQATLEASTSAPAETAPMETAPADTAEMAPADAVEAQAPAEAVASTEMPAPTPAVVPEPTPAPAMPDPANAPREGIDYIVLAEPQPTLGQGGIEVAEVFAYTCIHCANLQPSIDVWKPKLAKDVRYVYVPGAFGGVSDNFARAFYAAETMGLHDKTHGKLFNAVFVDKAFNTASEEEIADWFGTQGVDRDVFLSTMKSFSVTAKVNRARQFALRTNVESTPTMIIAGKYSAQATGDRGPQGLLQTIDWLVARERAQAAGAP